MRKVLLMVLFIIDIIMFIRVPKIYDSERDNQLFWRFIWMLLALMNVPGILY